MKRVVPILVLILILIVNTTLISIADDSYSVDQKIIINKFDTTSGFQRNMQLLPIELETGDKLAYFEHVSMVIPTINRIYRSFPENGSFPNRDMMPDTDQMPPDFHRQSQVDAFINQMADYIVEGVYFDHVESYLTSLLSIELTSGRFFSDEDSSVVILGEKAQEYFNAELDNTITIENELFTVIGIFDNETYNNYVFMMLADAQSIYDYSSDEVNTLYIFVESSDAVEDTIKNLSTVYPDLQIRSNQFNENMSFDENREFPSNQGNDFNIENNTPGFEVILLLFGILTLGIIIKYKRRK